MEETQLCELCGRILGGEISRHHLIPISRGGAGTTTIPLHRICHAKIHSVLSEKDLERNFNTMEKIRLHPELEKFIGWVKKKPADFYDSSVKQKKK
jgi:hypothetical protein